MSETFQSKTRSIRVPTIAFKTLFGAVILLLSLSIIFDVPEGLAVGSLSVLILLVIGFLFHKIQSEKLAYYIILLALLLILFIGLFSSQYIQDWQNSGILLVPALILSLIIGFVFVLQGQSGWVLASFIFFVSLGIFIVQFSFAGDEVILKTSMGIILAFSFVMGYAFFPRRLAVKKIIFPLTERRIYQPVSKKSNGFTLIELLIVISILGIMSTGTLHIWGTCIHAQKASQERVHIIRLLDAEMNALQQNASIITPSEEPQPLPIPLDAFSLPLALEGTYRAVPASATGMLRITVELTHEINAPEPRHYRLVSFVRGGDR